MILSFSTFFNGGKAGLDGGRILFDRARHSSTGAGSFRWGQDAMRQGAGLFPSWAGHFPTGARLFPTGARLFNRLGSTMPKCASNEAATGPGVRHSNGLIIVPSHDRRVLSHFLRRSPNRPLCHVAPSCRGKWRTRHALVCRKSDPSWDPGSFPRSCKSKGAH